MLTRLFTGLLLLGIAAPGRSEEILVFAAASLTESLEELGRSFERTTGNSLRFSFGSSSDLARQIAAGAPADVFFSADAAKMDSLEKAGIVRRGNRREFLSNRLAVVVPVRSELRIREPRDLLSLPRIALADPEAVPAGIYARRWLESRGLWRQIAPRVVPTLDVRAALAAVETESVAAAIVYKTDALTSKNVRTAYEPVNSPPILYSTARTESSGRAAADLVLFLESSEAAAVFQRYGFVVRTAD